MKVEFGDNGKYTIVGFGSIPLHVPNAEILDPHEVCMTKKFPFGFLSSGFEVKGCFLPSKSNH